jgi:3-hydroxyacyl-CoA dehydrogenase/enoyl-CoA hydratase/3-hydroxybutyryl-CoA epimerase
MVNITTELGADGILVATFDAPGRTFNTITLAVQEELAALADHVRDDASIKALVFRSGKPTGFCAGADLVEMEGAIADWRRATSQEELRAGVESASGLSGRVRALEICGKPVVMIVHGVAMGGGLELALGGHRRIAWGDPSKIRLSFPEATIGLLPGAGGTQRVPRLMGIAKSLPHLLDGLPISADLAIETGLLHEISGDGDAALDAARRWLLDNPSASQPWDVKGYRFPAGPHTPSGYATFPFIVAATLGNGPADHPARANILRAVYEGVQVPIDAGLRIESRYFFNTVRASASAAMVRTLFAARQAVAKATRSDPAPYQDRIRTAWQKAAETLVRGGAAAGLVRGVALSLSHILPAMTADPAAAHALDLPDQNELDRIAAFLLATTSEAARIGLADGLVASREEADLVAIEAGFPARTGGPLSYLENLRIAEDA